MNEMKNIKLGRILKYSSILLAFILIQFSAYYGNAKEPDKKWGIGGRISHYGPVNTRDEFIPPALEIRYEPDNSLLFEGNLTWLPIEWFSLEFSAGYFQTDIYEEAFSYGTSLGSIQFGELKQIPLLLTGRLHWWPIESRLNLYAGAGFGYYVNDFALTGVLENVIPGLSIEAENSFGLHFGGGLEWFFSKSWACNLDMKFLFNQADLTATAPGYPQQKEEIDLDAFIAGIGIKYYF